MFRISLPLIVIVLGVIVGIAFSKGKSSAQRGPVIDTTAREAAVRNPGTGHAEPASAPPPPPRAPSAQGGTSLAEYLTRWVAAGLLTSDQSTAIAAFEAAPAAPSGEPAAPRRKRVPLVAEALGYLGGMLGIIGIVVWVAGFWRDIAGGTRLAVSAVVAAVLVAIGFFVRADDEPAFARLRGFVWLAGSAAAGVVGGVVANDVLDATSGNSVAIGVAVGVLVVSGALWSGRARPAQQFSTLAALEVTAGVVFWAVGGPIAAGLVTLAISAAVLAAGVVRATPTPWLASAVGAVGALIGSALTIERWREPGSLLPIAVGLAVVALVETRRIAFLRGERIALLVFAVIAFIANVPSTIGYFGREAGIVTGLVVWIVGAASIGMVVRKQVVHPVTIELAGGVLIIAGAAAMAFQSGFVGVATIVGFASALAMLALGTRPGRVLMSVTGSLGLLVNVPWAISHFFPGENRAPLLIAVSGLLLVVVAVVLTRMGGRFRRELQR
ncbi:MAG: hypothetical protein RJB61_1614 [Actinomycetota bacterium]